ncbi:hypothetical protein AcW1_004379 [Taiwanofungus camphoratus]|nr:hypothetical protein AcW1_004379 [Antrodia cinnamomea]
MEAWQLLAAFAKDPAFNYGCRELPWYGLWNNILRRFEEVEACHIFPQYPLWLIKPQLPPSSPPNPQELSSDDDMSTGGFDPVPLLRMRLDQGQLTSPSTKSWSPPSSPLTRKSLAAGHSELPMLRGHSPDSPIIPAAPKISTQESESHKVTDFAVLQLRSGPRVIYDYVIPIIVEIKGEADEDGEKLFKAQVQVEEQVKYLFSSRRQPAVIAIAVSGSVWRWAQINKKDFQWTYGRFDDEDYIPSDDILESDSEWSDDYELGTNRSNRMLAKMHRWVRGAFRIGLDPSLPIPRLEP